jgi:hypothetical protein
MNYMYREELVFHNRSSNAMKVHIIAPRETRRFFEFIPKMGYIQGNSSFKIWVKLLARNDIKEICKKFIKRDKNEKI